MNTMYLTENQFNQDPYWCNPIPHQGPPCVNWVELFDQNGYDLTPVEIAFSQVNGDSHSEHRNHTHVALKQAWFTQDVCMEGAVLNHALIFERKAYAGKALAQLTEWANQMPLLWKVIRMRPKWGLDFSMDWADAQGNVFEILHFEFDGFDYAEIAQMKHMLDVKFQNTDWEAAAQELLRRKPEWHHLNFFEQSDYKCEFFGLPSERFKMVIWD